MHILYLLAMHCNNHPENGSVEHFFAYNTLFKIVRYFCILKKSPLQKMNIKVENKNILTV